MAKHLRITIDIAVPISVLQNNLTARQEVAAFVQEAKKIQARSTKINVGTDVEEDTVRARWHVCDHENRVSCSSDQDISTLTAQSLIDAIS